MSAKLSSMAWLPQLALVALLAGCGGDDRFATVVGKLTVDGKPVEGLEIIFEPQFSGGAPSIGFSDAGGQYEAMFTADRAGVMIGDHIVRISGIQYGEGSTKVLAKIPPKYGEKSTQAVKITSGANTFNLDINTTP